MRAEGETPAAKKLWGGRFTGKTDPLMEKFNESLPFDKRMWEEDIRVRDQQPLSWRPLTLASNSSCHGSTLLVRDGDCGLPSDAAQCTTC